VRRFVAQSYASARYAREGGPVKTEDDPLEPNPVEAARESWDAMAYLDRVVPQAGGIALRYGVFYGGDGRQAGRGRSQAHVADRRGRRRLVVHPSR
jgi:2-alkyl-3-oxoalkanoate reductase